VLCKKHYTYIIFYICNWLILWLYDLCLGRLPRYNLPDLTVNQSWRRPMYELDRCLPSVYCSLDDLNIRQKTSIVHQIYASMSLSKYWLWLCMFYKRAVPKRINESSFALEHFNNSTARPAPSTYALINPKKKK